MSKVYTFTLTNGDSKTIASSKVLSIEGDRVTYLEGQRADKFTDTISDVLAVFTTLFELTLIDSSVVYLNSEHVIEVKEQTSTTLIIYKDGNYETNSSLSAVNTLINAASPTGSTAGTALTYATAVGGGITIPYVLVYGQSNSVYDRGATMATNRIWGEAYRNILEQSDAVTLTNTNSGGDFGNANDLGFIPPPILMHSELSRLGVELGMDKYLDTVNFPKVFVRNMSDGGQPVSWFHKGGGSRISSQGAGWTAMEAQVRADLEWAKQYGYKLSLILIETKQGESNEDDGDTDENAALWANDWLEVHNDIKTLFNVTEATHVFSQIFHTDATKLAKRNRLNTAISNLATATSDIYYTEYITDDDIASGDPKFLFQDNEHDSYNSMTIRGIEAMKIGIDNYDATNLISIDYDTSADLEGEIQITTGALAVTGDIAFTEVGSSTITADGVEGDVITLTQAVYFTTDLTPSFNQGFSYALRFNYPSGSYVMDLVGNDGYGVQLSKGSGLPASFTALFGTDSISTTGSLAQATWHNLGITLGAGNGLLTLHDETGEIASTTITERELGNFSLGGRKRNKSQSGWVGHIKIFWLKNSPITEAEMITKIGTF